MLNLKSLIFLDYALEEILYMKLNMRMIRYINYILVFSYFSFEFF